MGNILEILKRTKDGMLNSLRKKDDTSLFNKPLNELEKLGIPATEREKIVSKLFIISGHKLIKLICNV